MEKNKCRLNIHDNAWLQFILHANELKVGAFTYLHHSIVVQIIIRNDNTQICKTVSNSYHHFVLWAIEHIVFEITMFTQSEVSSVALGNVQEIQLTLAQWKCCESFLCLSVLLFVLTWYVQSDYEAACKAKSSSQISLCHFCSDKVM